MNCCILGKKKKNANMYLFHIMQTFEYNHRLELMTTTSFQLLNSLKNFMNFISKSIYSQCRQTWGGNTVISSCVIITHQYIESWKCWKQWMTGSLHHDRVRMTLWWLMCRSHDIISEGLLLAIDIILSIFTTLKSTKVSLTLLKVTFNFLHKF